MKVFASILVIPWRSTAFLSLTRAKSAKRRSKDDMDNSDGKASLKRQKSPETTTDTQGMSKFY